MGILRRLFESRPWHTLEPAQDIVVVGQGIGESHVQAARASDGRFLFVYTPRDHEVGIDMTKVRGNRAMAPRRKSGRFPAPGCASSHRQITALTMTGSSCWMTPRRSSPSRARLAETCRRRGTIEDRRAEHLHAGGSELCPATLPESEVGSA